MRTPRKHIVLEFGKPVSLQGLADAFESGSQRVVRFSPPPVSVERIHRSRKDAPESHCECGARGAG